METKTHPIDRDNPLYLTKAELFKHWEQIVGFKVMCYDRIVGCHLDQENNPIFVVKGLIDVYPPHI